MKVRVLGPRDSREKGVVMTVGKSGLSPFTLGPVKLYDGLISQTMENGWRARIFGEESIELMQVSGMTREQVHHLVDLVYDKPVGDLKDEVGGVMTTLAAFCFTFGVDMVKCAHEGLLKNWSRTKEITAKQAIKRAIKL